ncbi:MAG: hypothetical protein RRY29_08600 [Desulfovibrionaceae bacterium]
MDFLKKNTAAADDDIIELTDIIEKGTETPTTSAQLDQKQAIDTQMDNLFSVGNKESRPIVPEDMDADIDALLADMQDSASIPPPHQASPAPQAASPTTLADDGAQSTTATAPLDANEELEMPNMAEVNALLEGLDIPPQPKGPATESKPIPSGDELDDLLKGLLDESNTPPAAAPQPATRPVVEAPHDSPPSFDAELDALLTPPSVAAPAASPPPPPAHTPAPSPQPELSLEEDLDAILGSIDSAPKAADTAAPAPQPIQKPEPATAADTAIDNIDLSMLDDDLTALLGQSQAPATSAPTAPKPINDEAIDLSDLGVEETEDFLSEIFETAKSGGKAAPVSDDLLAGLDIEDDVTQKTAPATATQSPQAAPTKPEPFTCPETIDDVAMFSPHDVADMPHLSADMPTPPEEQDEMQEEDALELAQDNLTAAPHQTVNEEIFSDQDIARAAQELFDEKIMTTATTTGAVDTNAWLNSLDEALGETTAISNAPAPTLTTDDTDDLLAQEDLAQEDSVNLDTLLAHLPNTVATLRNTTPTNDQRTPQCKPGEVCSASPSPTVTYAHSSFDIAYEQGLSRLQQITDRLTSSLAEADARIIALTQNNTHQAPIDSIFREDSPFTESLQQVVRTAVATELRAHTPLESPADHAENSPPPVPAAPTVPAAEYTALLTRLSEVENQHHLLLERITALEDGNTEARLQTVEARIEGQAAARVALEERCKLLEKHLIAQEQAHHDMEQRFQHDVEKAAAAAAANIIREEIAGILAGQ